VALAEEKLEAKMLLQVHDELVLEVRQTHLDDTLKLVRQVMENAEELAVPLKTEAKAGRNWYEMEAIGS
jgi:DNA polymerase-1